jgi:hypothetical protein
MMLIEKYVFPSIKLNSLIHNISYIRPQTPDTKNNIATIFRFNDTSYAPANIITFPNE